MVMFSNLSTSGRMASRGKLAFLPTHPHLRKEASIVKTSSIGKAIAAQEEAEEILIKEPKLSVVIPAYNEAKTIADVVRGSAKYADEVIVVDDGSSDNTSFVAKAAGAKVLRLPKNRGYGAALSVGLATAALDDADLIVYLDGDGQHDPEEIPDICAPVLRGTADLVIGSRFMKKGGNDNTPRYRTVGQNALTKATNVGMNIKVTDSQSGFRCLTKKVALSMDLTDEGMGFSSEMVRAASKLGLRVTEVPITCRYEGLDTSTHSPMKHGTSVLTTILRSIRDDHPLLYFGVGGIIMTMIGLGAGFYSIYQFLSVKALPFLPSMLAVLFFFLGLMSVFVGIILNSLVTHAGKEGSR